MEFEVTLKNYRCFPDSRPAKLNLRNGFTALVGVNNSGKSSLLKFFYEFRPLFRTLSNPTDGDFQNLVRGGITSAQFPPTVLDHTEVFCDRNGRDLQIELVVPCIAGPSEASSAAAPKKLTLTLGRGTRAFSLDLGTEYVKEERNSLHFDGTCLMQKQKVIADFTGYLEAARLLAETLYIGPFRNAINLGANQQYFDIQVGQAFIASWRHLKTGNVKTFNEDAFRLTQDIKRIFDFETLEINASLDDSTIQVILNGKSYKLSELGSGLTQFILVFANAAVKRPSYILLDEPELNLHPSLQLDFLTTLGSYASEGIVFGTHNIGLARASAERIYAVQKISEGESRITDFEGIRSLPEFLGELGYSGYRELGFDSVLLVEGATEVKTIQQLLRMYKKDHRTVLIPLGGSQMINRDREVELQEIKRISQNVVALIDSERTCSDDPLKGARQDFADSCRKAGIRCHVLERRAIENYLTHDAVVKVKGEKYRALAPYERLSDACPSWSKTENWRIAREMTPTDMEHTDLGEFLAGI